MPVTPDSHYYAPYSSPQAYSRDSDRSYAKDSNSDSSTLQSARHSDGSRAHHEQPNVNYQAESPVRPKRNPSFLRRINAAMRPKSSSSKSATLHESSPREHLRVNATRADPMYAAPSTTSRSMHHLPSAPMNPISRFRRARNAERGTRVQGANAEKEGLPGSPTRESAGPSRLSNGSSSSGYREAEDRRYDARWNPASSSRHARIESEGVSYSGRPGGTSAVYASSNQAQLSRSKTIGIPMHRGVTSPHIEQIERHDVRRYSPDRRIPEGSKQRTVITSREPGSSTTSNQRMGKYGIYASPPASPAHVSVERTQFDPSIGNIGKRRYTSPTRRVEGWEVQISPPGHSGVSNSSTECTRRPLKIQTTEKRPSSPLYVTDHPLTDRPLPMPPNLQDGEETEKFAMDLAKRMSVLLSEDIDYTSPSFKDGDINASPTNSSGTATPTVKDGSPANHEEHQAPPSASGTSDTMRPFDVFLSNAREMNDVFVRGTGSLWDKLFGKDKGKEKEPERAEENPIAGPETEENNVEGKPEDEESDIEGSRDIMLYSPLIPDAASIVEVAASEVVTLYGDGADEARERAYRAELRRRWADGRGFVSFDALSSIEPVQEEVLESDNNRVPEGEEQAQVDTPGITGDEQTNDQTARPKLKEKVIWVPSPTQISVQVLWWGYRIYLPPPVLHVLNSRSVETAKRAALLTSALTWLLENLPLSSLPPILAPAALLLRALVPLLGMIGTFVAWSWKATVTFDRGNGVVLSATWLLPIVLVPGTWEDGEVTGSGPSPAVGVGVGVESGVAGPSGSRTV